MVKFTIGTTTGRYEVVAQGSETLADVASAQGLSTSGVTFHVNGIPASSADSLPAVSSGNPPARRH